MNNKLFKMDKIQELKAKIRENEDVAKYMMLNGNPFTGFNTLFEQVRQMKIELAEIECLESKRLWKFIQSN